MVIQESVNYTKIKTMDIKIHFLPKKIKYLGSLTKARGYGVGWE